MRVISSGLLCLALLFLAVPAAPTHAQDKTTVWPTNGWQTSPPEAQGMNSEKLVEVFDKIARTGLKVNSVLVVRNGYIVVEGYRHPYTAEIPQHTNSGTKSILSALVGIAIDKGYIKSVNQPVLDFFSDRTVENVDARKQAVTLEHLLMMASGLESPAKSMIYALDSGKGVFEVALDHPMQEEPGKQFFYSGGSSALLAAVIDKVSGQDLMSFAQSNLFKPLGIDARDWWKDGGGYRSGGGGLQLTARDMAKFGYLYLNDGQWDGQQIVSADWVATSTRQHIAARPVAEGYGYHWWVSQDCYMASGTRGQYVIVAPQHHLVVVFTSDFADSNSYQLQAMFRDIVVPAIDSEKPLTKNPAGEAILQAAAEAFGAVETKVVSLPAMAKQVSGKVYRFDKNDLQLQSMTLTFTENESTAQFTINDFTPAEVGLDGRFRINQHPMPDQGSVFYRGSWLSDTKFLIEVDGPAAWSAYQTTLTFKDRTVEVQTRLPNMSTIIARGAVS